MAEKIAGNQDSGQDIGYVESDPEEILALDFFSGEDGPAKVRAKKKVIIVTATMSAEWYSAWNG
ncbi:MAG: hypothetical protein V8T45_08830 [Oscillospiraceae bacterium]